MNKYEASYFYLLLNGSGKIKQDYDESLERLKELVERATPKKVLKELSKYEGYYPQSNYWADCPNCKKTCYYDNETNDKFCPNCGQALDWSDR